MKPIEHVSAMAALDLLSGFANGDVALPLFLQTVALFLQKDIGKPRQRTTSSDCSSGLS